MDTTTIMLKAHIIIVSFFLLYFLFKTILLLAGKKELLDTVRKYKMVDMILGVLILLSGGYLWYATADLFGHRMWLDVKALLVVIAIGLGIVSMKKENKLMAIIVSLILIYVYGVAETKSLTFKQTPTEIVTEEVSPTEEPEVVIDQEAKALYEAHCNECHGFDGSLGKFSATNLKTSTMFFTKKVELITNGKGMMKGFGNELTKEEIEKIAGYLIHLK